MNQNQNCTIEYLYVETNGISDSLISINDDELKEFYKDKKEDRYIEDERKSLEYVLWEVPTEIKFDTLRYSDYQEIFFN